MSYLCMHMRGSQILLSFRLAQIVMICARETPCHDKAPVKSCALFVAVTAPPIRSLRPKRCATSSRVWVTASPL